jgi:hypothetical protein
VTGLFHDGELAGAVDGGLRGESGAQAVAGVLVRFETRAAGASRTAPV